MQHSTPPGAAHRPGTFHILITLFNQLFTDPQTINHNRGKPDHFLFGFKPSMLTPHPRIKENPPLSSCIRYIL